MCVCVWGGGGGHYYDHNCEPYALHHHFFCTHSPVQNNEIAFILRLYVESIRINRQDELFMWVLKADLACIVYYLSQADTAAEADDFMVISKEADGHSWGILSAILGHKYHQNRSYRHLNQKVNLITFVPFRMRMRHRSLI